MMKLRSATRLVLLAIMLALLGAMILTASRAQQVEKREIDMIFACQAGFIMFIEFRIPPGIEPGAVIKFRVPHESCGPARGAT